MYDNCFCFKGSRSTYGCIITSVDVVLIFRTDESLSLEVKSILDKAFTIKDLGVVHYFLGMEIAISQNLSSEELLDSANYQKK